jgi:Cofilin/tropomyosin-type actin-binding protein
VFDVEYELESGEGKRNKITFISWCPDDASQYVSFGPLFSFSVCVFVMFEADCFLCLAKDDVFIFKGSVEACA